MTTYQYPSETTELICPKCNDIVSYEDTDIQYNKGNPYPEEGCENCGYKIDDEETHDDDEGTYGDFIYDEWANIESDNNYRSYITEEICSWINEHNPNANFVLFESGATGWQRRSAIGIKPIEEVTEDFINGANPIDTSDFHMVIEANDDQSFIDVRISHHDSPTGESWRLHFVELDEEEEDCEEAWNVIRGYNYLTHEYFDEWKKLALAQSVKN